MSLDLFRCERFRAELTARACVINQGKGRVSEEYRFCLECETGRVLREVRGQEPPEMRRNWSEGTLNKEENRRAPEQIPPGPPLEKGGEDQDGAGEGRVETETHAKTPRRQDGKGCREHPEREALQSGLCLECKREYQREWLRRKKAGVAKAGNSRRDDKTPKGKEEMKGKTIVTARGDVVRLPNGQPLTVAGEAEAHKILEAVAKLEEEVREEKGLGNKACTKCGVRPRHKTSNRCLQCLQEQISDPAWKEKRQAGIASKSRAAYEALRQVEAGELIRAEERYKPIFDLVPGLEERLAELSRESLRSLEAQMAFVLRRACLDGGN